jgi:hypothetical protein
MCEEHRECKECPADHECWGSGFADSDESELEATLTKWAEEHPERTIADDFFEKHPRGVKKRDGTPLACAVHLGYIEKCPDDSPSMRCAECWRRPLEEVEG